MAVKNYRHEQMTKFLRDYDYIWSASSETANYSVIVVSGKSFLLQTYTFLSVPGKGFSASI